MDLSEYCKKIKEKYPDCISKEQMRIICHIGKRKALDLLLQGIIPYKDNGKLTRKYTIKTDDVINYLIKSGGKTDYKFSYYSEQKLSTETLFDRYEKLFFGISRCSLCCRYYPNARIR